MLTIGKRWWKWWRWLWWLCGDHDYCDNDNDHETDQCDDHDYNEEDYYIGFIKKKEYCKENKSFLLIKLK